MYIPLAMAKVRTLYHFYGMILLGCHRWAKGEFKSATPELRDYIGSLSLTLSLSLTPQISIAALSVSMHQPPLFTPSLLSHLVISLSVSLYFDSAHVIHSCISVTPSLSGLEQREHEQRGENTQTYCLSLALPGSREGSTVDLLSGDPGPVSNGRRVQAPQT